MHKFRARVSKSTYSISILIIAILIVSTISLGLIGCKKREETQQQEPVEQTSVKTKPVVEPTPEPQTEPEPQPQPEPQPKPEPQPVPPKPTPKPIYVPKPQPPKPAPKPIINNLIIDEKGTYDKNAVLDNVEIQAYGAYLENKTINKDVIITEGVYDGKVNLRNVKIEGTLYINGGKDIYLDDVQCKNIQVYKDNGNITLSATGKSIFDNLTAYSSLTLKEKNLHDRCDGFINVTSDKKGGFLYVDLTLDDTEIQNLYANEATHVKSVDNNAYIETVKAYEAVKLGSGVKVDRFVAYEDDSTYKIKPNDIDNKSYSSGPSQERTHHHSNRKYLAKPDVNVIANDNYGLNVSVTDMDIKADKCYIKLYIDGNLQCIKSLRDEGDVTFINGETIDNTTLNLEGTQKHIEVYLTSDKSYENSDEYKWYTKKLTEPSNLKITENQDNTISITWNDNNGSDECKYMYSVGNNEFKNTTSPTSITNIAKSSNTETMTFKVKAIAINSIFENSQTSSISYTANENN